MNYCGHHPSGLKMSSVGITSINISYNFHIFNHKWKIWYSLGRQGKLHARRDLQLKNNLSRNLETKAAAIETETGTILQFVGSTSPGPNNTPKSLKPTTVANGKNYTQIDTGRHKTGNNGTGSCMKMKRGKAARQTSRPDFGL